MSRAFLEKIGYLNPSGVGMRFDFSSMLGIGRITSKYMEVGYGEGEGEGEGKTRPHPRPIVMLNYVLDDINKRHMILIMF